jgi:hypothetical protein
LTTGLAPSACPTTPAHAARRTAAKPHDPAAQRGSRAPTTPRSTPPCLKIKAALGFAPYTAEALWQVETARVAEYLRQ